MQNQPVN